MTPARQAATYSPALWPIIAAGVDAPRLEQLRRARTRSRKRGQRERGASPGARVAASASRWRAGTAARADRAPSCGCTTRAHASIALAVHRLGVVEIAPHARVLRAAAREQEDDRGRVLLRGSPWRRASDRRGVERGDRLRRDRGTTTARRCAKALRPTWSVYATSASVRSGCAAGARARFAVAASSAVAVLRREHEQLTARAGAGADAARAGASSRITWALVPPAPSAVTPARRGRRVAGHARELRRSRRTGVLAKSICGLGVS